MKLDFTKQNFAAQNCVKKLGHNHFKNEIFFVSPGIDTNLLVQQQELKVKTAWGIE